MDLLDANDRAGRYPDSWYAATADPAPPRPPLSGDRRVDVCVVGAGYTGLSAALHLAEGGADVLVVEAHRAGFGASGRNGGQLGSGQRRDQMELEPMVGKPAARRLWELGEDAKGLVKDLVARHGIACALKSGVAATGSTRGDVAYLHDLAAHMAQHYDYDMQVLDEAGFHAICPSPDYKGGIVDWGAAHLHPLRYALGLARAAEAAGAVIHEGTRVTTLVPGAVGAPVRVETDGGTVLADHVVLACNGYLGGLEPRVAARVMPINNFIVATEPLGDRVKEVLTRDIAVADSRFVVNYFRLSEDGRLLFGGGESYGYRFPKDIRKVVSKPMLQVFPQLRDVRLDYAWGGTLAITMARLPYLAQVAPGVISASGYSGHGVGSATHAGQMIALALQGQADGFDTLAALPTQRFPGGTALRNPLLVLAMTWYALRDRLGL